MAVTKRLRYEVLRRDSHACRYCGATAPDVKLTVDHVTPVALGGTDEPTNLVAACAGCNLGKSSTSPDEPLVADVEEKAMLWGRAIEAAIARRQAARAQRRLLLDYFEDEWCQRYESAAPMDGDWAATVVNFVQRGLQVDELDEAIDIAYAAQIADRNRWRYFCGVCWRKISTLNDIAQELIEAGEVE